MQSHRKQNKNALMVIGIAVLAFLLSSFKKKPQGSVDVGLGEFGKFGTDGILRAEDLRTPTFNPMVTKVNKPFSKAPLTKGTFFKHSVKSTLPISSEKYCETCR